MSYRPGNGNNSTPYYMYWVYSIIYIISILVFYKNVALHYDVVLLGSVQMTWASADDENSPHTIEFGPGYHLACRSPFLSFPSLFINDNVMLLQYS